MTDNTLYIDRVFFCGGVFCYKKGTDTLHKVNAPAIMYSDGTVGYFVNGVASRIDGPVSIVFSRYLNTYSINYAIDGKYYCENEFYRLIAK